MREGPPEPSTRPDRLTWRRALTTTLVLYVALRTGLTLIGLFAASQEVGPPCWYETSVGEWPRYPPLAEEWPGFGFVGVWQRWDACWYGRIAAFGYEPGQHSTAFFPLFPAATRLVSPLVAGELALAGMVVSNLAYVTAAVGMLHLVAEFFGRRVAERSVLYLSIFPAAFFLFAPFAESLYLAGAVWCLLLAERGRWPFAAVAGVVATLTRPHGVLLVLPLAWQAGAQLHRRLRTDPRPGLGELAAAAAPIAFALVLLPAVFLGWAVAYTGSIGESALDAQGSWGASFHFPWDVIGSAVSWTIENSDPVMALNVVSLVGYSVLAVVGAFRLPVVLTLAAVPPIVLVATRIQASPLTSTSRYLLVVFPAFVVLALLGRRPRVHQAIVIVSTVLLGMLAYVFARSDFVA